VNNRLTSNKVGDFELFLKNIPAFFCSICVSTYWLIVFIKAILITPKIGKTPNVIPKELLGFLSRLIMLPLITFWLIIPWLAVFSNALAIPFLAWLGVLFCILALAFSIYCWYYMGEAWRIGIDPKEKTSLLSQGPFSYVRHPIYALSMLLMLGTYLTIQTKIALLLLGIHWILFTLEAVREEGYLKKVHNENYYEYAKNTNRFLPFFRR
jgi:protein-S-isoprenylcysteine O-methyltransferase Ste14